MPVLLTLEFEFDVVDVKSSFSLSITNPKFIFKSKLLKSMLFRLSACNSVEKDNLRPLIGEAQQRQNNITAFIY